MAEPTLDKKLLRAAKKGTADDINRLLDQGANIEVKGGFFSLGQTPLGVAVWYNNKDAVQALLKRGANTEARDDSGETPLLVAAEFDRNEMAELLLAHNADPRARRDAGERETPSEVAIGKKNYELSRRLERALIDIELRERLARDKARRDQEAAEKAERDAERRKNADIVIVSQPLADRSLQEIYNFKSLERISLVRRGEDGPVEAITRQSFSDIGDKPCLREAFSEHVRRGGAAPEGSVFPSSIQIVKPLQRPQP